MSLSLESARNKDKKYKKGVDKQEKMCGEALKSKMLFRRDVHELHAKDAAEDIEFDVMKF